MEVRVNVHEPNPWGTEPTREAGPLTTALAYVIALLLIVVMVSIIFAPTNYHPNRADHPALNAPASTEVGR